MGKYWKWKTEKRGRTGTKSSVGLLSHPQKLLVGDFPHELEMDEMEEDVPKRKNRTKARVRHRQRFVRHFSLSWSGYFHIREAEGIIRLPVMKSEATAATVCKITRGSDLDDMKKWINISYSDVPGVEGTCDLLPVPPTYCNHPSNQYHHDEMKTSLHLQKCALFLPLFWGWEKWLFIGFHKVSSTSMSWIILCFSVSLEWNVIRQSQQLLRGTKCKPMQSFKSCWDNLLLANFD